MSDEVDGEMSSAVRVVVVTHDSEAQLDSCLAALPEAFGAVPYEVVVADSGSTEPPNTIVSRHQGARLVALGANLGYGAAINRGAAGSSGPLLVLNPDVVLSPGSVTHLLDALEIPGTGIAVPRLVDDDGVLARSLRRRPTALRAWGEALLGERAGLVPALGHVVVDRSAYDRDTVADWATGAAMLVSTECRAAVGEWDESYFLYSEETDVCLRGADLGFATRLAHRAHAVHTGGESQVSPRLWSILVHNRVRLQRRRRGRIRSAPFELGLLANELLRSRRESRHAAGLKAVIRAPRDADLDAASSRVPPWVCFSAQDWWYHNRAHSDFQIMQRIARDRDVLFVNSIGMRMPRPGRTSKASMRILRKARSVARLVRRPLPDLPRFAVYSPLVVPAYGSPVIRRLNYVLVRAQVGLVQRLLFGRTAPVTMVTIPTAWEVVRHTGHRRLLYNRSDKHSAFEETDQGYIADLESQLLANADRVMYVSHALMEEDAALVGERSRFIDHGVDLDHFTRPSDGSPHPALECVERPRVGFFGGIDDYVVDLDLLEHLAVRLPDHSLVLVGDATCDMDALTRHPNVHWFGFRPYEEMPAFGAGFDVAIMPWLQNEWIAACNPIKLKEYLALDLRVVSTPFPELSHYPDLVEVAGSPDEFVEAVQRATSTSDPLPAGARRAAVSASSWDQVAARVRRIGEES